MTHKVATVSTVKAPIDELQVFIENQQSIGVDHIILFFDDPTDAAMAAVANDDKLTLIPCSEAYWQAKAKQRPDSIEQRQSINATVGLQLAREHGCQWIIHIDSDELLYPLTDLHAVLTQCHADLVKFEVLEAVSEQVEYTDIFVPDLFKRPPNAIQLRLARWLGCKRAIFNGQYFRGHLASKVAVRITDKIKSLAIHGPQQVDGPLSLQTTREVKLLHFDCIGFAAWKRKWSRRLDGSATATNMRGNRQQQYAKFIQAFAQGDEALLQLYQQLQVIPAYEKRILTMLGMLIRLKNPHIRYK